MANDEIIIKIATDVDKSQIQDLESEIENLKRSAESVDDSGFDGLSTGADTATESVENLETSLDGLSMLAVGDVLQQYGDQAEQMAQSMNEANITVGQLAIQTGVAEPQLRSMIAGISNATFPTNEAMMYVKSLDQMGVSANNLGTSASGLDMINDAFGLGADKVNSLGQELGVLGVDMNNVSSSFNALAYANANTVGGMDNYYNFLRRYDSQFKELGLNVDQASVVIAAATQKFGGGRAALSGLSSILKESNGDLSVMEQQLGLTAGSLSNASELTGQYTGQLEQMAQQEADHKTLLDEIGSAWDRLSMVMSGVLSPVASLIGAGGQLIGVGTQLNGTLELLGKFRSIGNPFGGLRGHLSSLKTNVLGTASTIKSSLLTAFTSLSSTISTTVIPAVSQAALKFLELSRNTLMAGLNALRSAAMWVAEKVALVASTIATTAMSIAQGILNAVMAINPIMLVVMALAALVVGLIWAYQNVDWFRQMVDGAWASLQQLAAQIWGYVKPAFDMISNTVSGFTSMLGLEKDSWINTILSFLIFVETLPIQLAVIFTNAIAKAAGFGDNFVQTMTDGAMNAVNGFIDWIKQMKDKLVEELGHMLDEAKNFAMDIANTLTLGGAGMVAGWVSGSGENSPGYMYDHFVGELSAMEKAPNDFDLSGGMKTAGSSMVNAFKPNLGSSSTGVVGTNNITINIESVDNEERIQEIVDAVEEALKFDNLTAGRTA